jgi:hypothetical protein
VKLHLPTVVRVATAATLLLTVGGCYRPGKKNPFAAPGSGEGEGTIQVRVENQNFGDATVHALRGGERIRVGQVTGKSSKQFEVQWRFSVPLEFQIDIIGGNGCGIRPMTVDPGDKIWVRIPPEVGASPCYAGKS